MARLDAFELATRRAKERQATVPTAVAARYDRRTGRIVIRLSSKLEVAFSPQDAQGLEPQAPLNSMRSRLLHRVLAFTSRSSMQTFTCLPC
jgi:hypothetical protein